MVTPVIPNLTDVNPLTTPATPDDASREAATSPRRATAVHSARRTGTSPDGDAVVLKVWEQLPADDRERFVREWRIAGMLDGHPGIAKVHDGGRDGDQVWLVRDHIDGTSLHEQLLAANPAERGATTADEVHRRANHHLGVARIVAYAHRNGVVHGALKPTNVFRGGDSQAMITDFSLPGLTTHCSDDRDDPSVAPWLAPEIATGGRATPAADVYSLGAMLHAALTGTTPAPPSSADGLASATENFDLDELRNLPGLGSALVPLLTAALAVNPQRRPPNAGVFAEALSRVVAPEAAEPAERAATPAFAPRPQPAAVSPGEVQAEHNRSERQRAKRGAVLTGVGLAAAAVLVAFAWSFLVDLTRTDTQVETAAPDERSAPVSTLTPGDDPDDTRPATTAVATDTSVDSSAQNSDSVTTAQAEPGTGLDADSTAPPEPTTEPEPTAAPEPTTAAAPTPAPEPTTVPEPTAPPAPAPTTAPRPTARPAPTAPPASVEAVPTLASTQQPIVAPTTVAEEPAPADSELIYEGSRFEAALPSGWTPVSENRDVGYGYRTRFRGPDGDFLYIDLTPPTHHDGSETIEQSARRIAAQTASAGPVVKLTLEDKTTWWFEYTGNDGSARIDVFFAIGDTGYAVVGGSHDDPHDAYQALIGFVQTLRQV